jgi:hypothetical protein
MMNLRNTQYAIRNTLTHHASRITHHASRFAWARTHTPALVSLLLVAMLYVAALAATPPEGLTHHDTGAKYLQVRNLRLTTSGLDWSINYPARSLDPTLQFVPFNPKQYEADSQGRIYLQWPIFLGLLTRIPWKIMGFWGLYLVPLLAGLGTLWAAYLLALAVGMPRRIAWLTIPLLGLATPISIYSLLFFEHTLAALLVTLSLLAAVLSARGRSQPDDPRTAPAEGEEAVQPTSPNARLLAVSAALLAFAVYFRSELYILAFVMVLLYALDALRRHRWRPLLVWLGAFLLALVPLWAFYAINEGNILPLHATWYFAGSDASAANTPGGIELPRLRYITEAGLGIIPDFLLGPSDAQKAPLSPNFPPWAVIPALLGIALCALPALVGLARRPIPPHWQLYTLTTGLALILLPTAATLFSPQPYYNLHGFLLASPFIALALLPLGPKSKVQSPKSAFENTQYAIRNTQSIIWLHVVLHALIISALSGLGPISRHEWGQRYLLPAYPALTVLALFAGWRIWCEHSARLRKPAITALALGGLLVAVGVGFSVRGYLMLSDERSQVVAWQALARTLPAREPLLTDSWWLPLNLAADFYTRPVMLAEGDERIAQWAAQMRTARVTTFGLMSPNPAIFDGAWTGRANTAPVGPPREVRGMWLQRYILSP